MRAIAKGFAHIIGDFHQGAPLRTRRRKGHCPPKLCFRALGKVHCATFLFCAFHFPYGNLVQQQLFKRKTPLRLSDLRHGLRCVQGKDRVRRAHQLIFSYYRQGQRFSADVLYAFQRLLYKVQMRFLRYTVDRFIHGVQCGAVLRPTDW